MVSCIKFQLVNMSAKDISAVRIQRSVLVLSNYKVDLFFIKEKLTARGHPRPPHSATGSCYDSGFHIIYLGGAGDDCTKNAVSLCSGVNNLEFMVLTEYIQVAGFIAQLRGWEDNLSVNTMGENCGCVGIFFLEHFHFTLIISTSDTWMQVLPLWNSESFRGCETSGLLFEKLFRVFVALTPENEK